MEDINYNNIFANLPAFTGLHFVLKGRKWFGRFYIDGRPAQRYDKTVSYMKNGRIYLNEAGGERLSLWDWLLRYGGLNSNHDVYEYLTGDSAHNLSRKPAVIPPEPELKYVYPQTLRKTLKDRYQDNLFIWLSTLFGEKKVQRVYSMYKVGNIAAKDTVMTVFWYVDRNGNVCFDKKMAYRTDGHRDKTRSCGRKFKVDMGFRAHCYFGEHLLPQRKENQRVFVVESEKTAIILSLCCPKNIYLATGGVSLLRDIQPDWILLRDYDPAGEAWESKGNCCKWWEHYDNVKQGWDIADALLNKKFGIV